MGPVLDIQLVINVMEVERGVYSYLRDSGFLWGQVIAETSETYLRRQIPYPSVYDCVIITRPSVSFRDGLITANSLRSFELFLSEIPYNDSLVLVVSHVLSGRYDLGWSHWLVPETTCSSSAALNPSFRLDGLVGLTALYILIRSYSNCLVAEVSQQIYGGVVRCVSLGSTDGLST